MKSEMGTTDDKEKLIELLNKQLSLTPYESKAYIAVLLHGPLSPRGVNQKSGIPRPRTYDVLNSLVGKGLLMEQPGRPRMYAAVNPPLGLDRMMADLERKMFRQLEVQRRTAERLSSALSRLHDKSREMAIREETVWVTRKDSAFMARYCEAIRNIERELVLATPNIKPPEKEILEAVENVLKKKKSVRVIRQITSHWTPDDLDEYENLIRLGDQVRYLKYDGLRFAVADKRDVVLVLPSKRDTQFAVWISLPWLAAILYEHFEALWKKAQPALPILRRLRAVKA